MCTHVRKATRADLEGIMRVQRSAYDAAHVESERIFGSIIDHGMSFVAIASFEVVGFVLCHPTARDTVYLLHEMPHPPPSHMAPWVFIHDLSVCEAFRGQGVARKLLHALELESGTGAGIQLMAVHGADTFWERMGFVARIGVHLGEEVTRSYGCTCVFMEKESGATPKNI